jgi:hypothetical protein
VRSEDTFPATVVRCRALSPAWRAPSLVKKVSLVAILHDGAMQCTTALGRRHAIGNCRQHVVQLSM